MIHRSKYYYSQSSMVADAIDELCKIPPYEFAKVMANELDNEIKEIPMRVVIAEGVEREVIDGTLILTDDEYNIVKSAVTEELDNELLTDLRKFENDELKKKIKALTELLMNVRLGTGDIFCDDINDENWFDVRERLIGE